MGGAKTANKIQLPVALTFDFDAGSCRLDTTNTEPPCAALRAACGATETIPLICNLLQRCKVPAIFFTPGLHDRPPLQRSPLPCRGD
jgi:hypothetical protein